MSISQSSQDTLDNIIDIENVTAINVEHGSSESDFEDLSDLLILKLECWNPIHEILDSLIKQNAQNLDMICEIDKLFNKIIISPNSVIDELDKVGDCILLKMLKFFISISFKDTKGIDVVELTLNKSYLDYRNYQNGEVLVLLMKYDKKIQPRTIKYLQWQILSREGEELMIHWQKIKQDVRYNDVSKIPTEVKLFINRLHKSMKDEKHLDNVIEVVFASGSLELLKYLMKLIIEYPKKFKLITPLIMNAVRWGVFVRKGQLENFQKCFEYLVDVLSKDEINATDEEHASTTALHLADDYNEQFMVQKLLEKGASITAQNEGGRFPIKNTNYLILKQFFDTQIMKTPKRFLNDVSVWKLINSHYSHEYNLNGFIFVDLSTFECPVINEKSPNFKNLKLITYISGTPRLSRLIDHPIIAIMLELHWTLFMKHILLDQISVISMLITTVLFVIKYSIKSLISQDLCEVLSYVIAGITSVFLFGEIVKNYSLFHLMVVKLKQGWSKIRKSIKMPTNLQQECYLIQDPPYLPCYQTVTSIFLKIPLFILLILFAVYDCDHNTCKQTIGVGIILLAVNTTLLIAYYNQTVAHYVIMFLYVAYNGLNFILSMFLIIFGFAIGLFMLIDNFRYENTNNFKAGNNSDWESIGLSTLRALVMSTGELEVSSLEFHAVTSYIVFVFFIFVIPIVFFNLLNGLAIEDISMIKKEAMYWYRKTQLTVLIEFQQFHTKINKIMKCIPDIDISIYPNVIGDQSFIGIEPGSRKIFAMSGLKMEDRKLIGILSKNALMNAQEILQNFH
uniref:CSON012677 protein n=1 Tax=Culicoides sonorensis TaxID=179676 RepID=A0A336MAA0_CULSO